MPCCVSQATHMWPQTKTSCSATFGAETRRWCVSPARVTDTETDTDRYRQTNRQTQRQTQTDRHRQTDRHGQT